ncbi:MAG: Nif3-like dinuclear metal center hexameric protein, partial [Gorillibacterium sp.]|nr:Nif3-like dinuclear metal center hexameric protein [Gorillibacterium sp.]
MGTSIQEIIDFLLRPVEPLETTVDRLMFGDPHVEVKGVATAFVASHYVIERAKLLGANLLITHEGLFYSHVSPIPQLEESPVYKAKYRSIEESKMAIFRLHDYIHRYEPDGIM